MTTQDLTDIERRLDRDAAKLHREKLVETLHDARKMIAELRKTETRPNEKTT